MTTKTTTTYKNYKLVTIEKSVGPKLTYSNTVYIDGKKVTGQMRNYAMEQINFNTYASEVTRETL